MYSTLHRALRISLWVGVFVVGCLVLSQGHLVIATGCPDQQQVTVTGQRSSGGVGQYCDYGQGSSICPSGYHLSGCDGATIPDYGQPSCEVQCTCTSDDYSCMGPPPNTGHTKQGPQPDGLVNKRA
jgi:hypothetical protein